MDIAPIGTKEGHRGIRLGVLHCATALWLFCRFFNDDRSCGRLHRSTSSTEANLYANEDGCGCSACCHISGGQLGHEEQTGSKLPEPQNRNSVSMHNLESCHVRTAITAICFSHFYDRDYPRNIRGRRLEINKIQQLTESRRVVAEGVDLVQKVCSLVVLWLQVSQVVHDASREGPRSG